MSLIITTYVREGIVMSSDSRLSINSALVHNITQTDSVRKTFLTENGIGISTCGAADVKGVPISGFVDSFISEEIGNKRFIVEDVADKLMNYFKLIDPELNTIFHVAGYDKMLEVDRTNEKNQIDKSAVAIVKTIHKQSIYIIEIKTGTKIDIIQTRNPQDTVFHGETKAIARLLNTATIQHAGQSTPLPFNGIPYSFFTLQDAIDFNRFVIQTTIDAMRFELAYKTVGGPIDVLVIKPEKVEWISKKNLI